MRRYRRRTRPQYLLPFLALVGLGVFIILAFQLWGSFFPNAKGDAVFYIADGRSKVLSFGTTEWENVYNGSKVKIGDSVKTLSGGRGEMSFYDGTVVRMDENTQVTLVDITKKNDYQEILLYLNEGKVWVNKPKENVIRKTDFIINTNNASYAITGTIFDLEKLTDETLRVLRGQVQVDILENADGKTRTIESIPVGIGQQVLLTETAMKSFLNRESPSVLGAIDANFETTDWYNWNAKEDENPTNFAAGGTSGTINDSQSTGDNTVKTPVTTSTATTTTTANLSDLAAPTLITPKASSMDTTVDKQTISGKAVAGVKKILLRQTVAGSTTTEKILITSFDASKLSWSYDLSLDKGNIKAGKNVYMFVGVDENAKETAPLDVEINYQGATTSEPDLANNLETLVTPKILQIDGKTYKDGMTVDKDGFTITGSAGGASEVWVEDFKLNKFKAGDSAWSYNVKVSYGNLVPGVNTFAVYSKDASGKKSTVVTAKINYQPKVIPAKTTTTSTTISTAAGTSTTSSSVSNDGTSSAGAEGIVHY